MQDDQPYLKDKHLRLTLQIEKNKTTILDINVIDEALVELGSVVGPFIVNVTFGSRLSWIDTMQDPFVQRGMPRRGEHEHHYEMKSSTTVVARIPIARNAMPDDFRVDFYRANEPPSERLLEFERRLTLGESRDFEHISTVDLPMLQKHPEWDKIMKQAGIEPQGGM